MDVFKGEFKWEFPISLEDLQDHNFRFSPATLKTRLSSTVEVDKRLETQAQALVQRLPPNLQFNMKSRLAMAKFFRGFDWIFKFADLGELVAAVPRFDQDDNPNGLEPAAIQSLKEGLNQAAQIPVAQAIEGALGPLAMVVGQIPPPLQQLYGLVQECVLGLRRVHLQVHAQCSRLDIKGLDFVPLLPPPAAGGFQGGGYPPYGGGGADGFPDGGFPDGAPFDQFPPGMGQQMPPPDDDFGGF